jgi:hypothetical protein
MAIEIIKRRSSDDRFLRKDNTKSEKKRALVTFVTMKRQKGKCFGGM